MDSAINQVKFYIVGWAFPACHCVNSAAKSLLCMLVLWWCARRFKAKTQQLQQNLLYINIWEFLLMKQKPEILVPEITKRFREFSTYLIGIVLVIGISLSYILWFDYMLIFCLQKSAQWYHHLLGASWGILHKPQSSRRGAIEVFPLLTQTLRIKDKLVTLFKHKLRLRGVQMHRR